MNKCGDNNPSERFETSFRPLIPELTDPECRAIARCLEKWPFEVISPPGTGLIMVTATDCFETDFHLGEVLVTTAEVDLQGVRGHATVMGRRPEKADLAARINALVRSGRDGWIDAVEPLLTAVRQRLADRLEKEKAMTAATRVRFQSMAEER
jgi:alpha-D-ribose 1-methylphosphonate 5-triphosphate synthase subunit PhnG